MASVKVTLRDCETFTAPASAGGRRWKRGQTTTLTNQKEIDYYRAQSEFRCTEVAAPPKRAAKPAATGDGDDGGGAPVKHTEDDLSKMKKDDLVALAESMHIACDDGARKVDIVKAILEVQG